MNLGLEIFVTSKYRLADDHNAKRDQKLGFMDQSGLFKVHQKKTHFHTMTLRLKTFVTSK